MLRVVWLSSLSLLLLGCGPGRSSDGTTSESDSEGPETGETGDEADPIEQFIADYCQAWVAVECPWPRYDSFEECVEHQRGELEPWVAQLDAGTMEFDPDCAASKLPALAEGGDCSSYACTLFHGSKAQGEACELTPVGVASECAAGMSCHYQDGCQPICVIAGEGESCALAECEDGLVCLLGPMTCAPAPKPGDPCLDDPYQCGLDMWCDGGVCSDQYGAVGAPCDSAPCDSDQAWCDADVCVPLLPDGQPCTSIWQCESHACVLGQCVPLPTTVGAPCHQERECGAGLDCHGISRTCIEPYQGRACILSSWCPPYVQSNDVCDEGDGPDQCPPNTDAADCGYCTEFRQNDGQCDEPQFCAPGTDPDC